MMPQVRIGDVCEVVSGATPRRDNPDYWNGSVPWVTPKELANLDGPTIGESAERITEVGFKSCSTRMLPPGAVLYSSRAPIGHVAIATISMCTNQGFKSLVPSAEIDSAFLYWVMKWATPSIEARASGTTFKEVSKSEIEDVRIPLPAVSEQRRIAAILDEADGLRRRRREALGLLDDLLRSAFLEMFGDPVTNPRGWPRLTFGDVFETQLGKMLDAKKNVGELYPYLGNRNVQWDRCDLSDLQEMRFTPEDRKRFELRPGDLLVCEGGEAGRTAIWRGEVRDCFFQKAIHRLRPRGAGTPEYALHYMKYAVGGGVLRHLTTATSIAHLTKEKFEEAPFLSPPTALQEEFSRFCAAVGEERGRSVQAEGAASAFFDSLLQRAFAGDQ